MEKQLVILLIGCILIAVFESLVILKTQRKFAGEAVIIIPLTAETRNAEYIMRETICNIIDSNLSAAVIFSDFGADEETLMVCKKMMGNYRKFYLVKSENVQKIIANLV